MLNLIRPVIKVITVNNKCKLHKVLLSTPWLPLLLYTVRIHAVQYNVIDSVSLSRNSIC